jgi:8-oxo-dGTP pyrophosphatase MutT (NUDIX family)
VVEVVLGALVRQGQVLLAHRSASKRAYPGVWDLPGGVVEVGETELEALARELHEELGVWVAADSVTHLCRVTARPGDEPVLLSAWLVPAWGGVPANVAPDEHDAIRWFGIGELPPPVHPAVWTALEGAIRG